MEFSYNITESAYRQAFWMRAEVGSGGSVVKIGLWTFFIVAGLILFLTVVLTKLHESASLPIAAVAQHSFETVVIYGAIGPALLICLWIFLVVFPQGKRLRNVHRKDPCMQGRFNANITSTSVAIANSAGASAQATWDLYDYWREGAGLVVLVLKSGGYQILNLASLSETQCAELRGILTSVLPEK